jgi:hypothetical protein
MSTLRSTALNRRKSKRSSMRTATRRGLSAAGVVECASFGGPRSAKRAPAVIWSPSSHHTRSAACSAR